MRVHQSTQKKHMPFKSLNKQERETNGYFFFHAFLSVCTSKVTDAATQPPWSSMGCGKKIIIKSCVWYVALLPPILFHLFEWIWLLLLHSNIRYTKETLDTSFVWLLIYLCRDWHGFHFWPRIIIEFFFRSGDDNGLLWCGFIRFSDKLNNIVRSEYNMDCEDAIKSTENHSKSDENFFHSPLFSCHIRSNVHWNNRHTSAAEWDSDKSNYKLRSATLLSNGYMFVCCEMRIKTNWMFDTKLRHTTLMPWQERNIWQIIANYARHTKGYNVLTQFTSSTIVSLKINYIYFGAVEGVLQTTTTTIIAWAAKHRFTHSVWHGERKLENYCENIFLVLS